MTPNVPKSRMHSVSTLSEYKRVKQTRLETTINAKRARTVSDPQRSRLVGLQSNFLGKARAETMPSSPKQARPSCVIVRCKRSPPVAA